MLMTVISPVYNAEKIVNELIRRIQESLSDITVDYEIILVEDGSKDGSWDKIVEQHKMDCRVKGIKLSRNFGQHHAITAGLDKSKGDWVVVMDCDLQDQPEEIPRLYAEALKGYDIVFAKRENRNDSFFKIIYSRIFYRLFTWLSGVPQDGSIANFGIYSSKAIQSVNELREPMRSFSVMIKWVGFNSSSIFVEHAKRYEGRSTYSFKKLIKLALDISIAFSDKLLHLTIKLGAWISFGSFLFGLITLYRYFNGSITEPGYTSLIVSLWFLSGLIIFILGVIGLYLSKVFEGIKQRPLYIIKEFHD